MNRDGTTQKAGYPRIAISQRLRRTLQQVRNRSHWGAAVMQHWRLLLRQKGNVNTSWRGDKSGGR